VRFFIPRLLGAISRQETNRICRMQSMPRNIHAGKAVSS
jgi:hypothetical protein